MIKVLRRPVEFTLGAVIRVKDRPSQVAAGARGGGQGIDDQFGAHVLGDGPADQTAGVQVDNRC